MPIGAPPRIDSTALASATAVGARTPECGSASARSGAALVPDAPVDLSGLSSTQGERALSARPAIYQLPVRLFGNVKGANRTSGDLHENGVGKFSDINAAALQRIKEMGVTHVWLTGVLRQATATDYSALGLPADDPDVVKGKAGSFYAVKDYYDVCPDYADDPARRRDEFKALVGRVHAAGLQVLIDFVPNHVARGYRSVVHPERDFGGSDDQTRAFSPANNFFYLTSHPGRPLTLERPPHLPADPAVDGRFAPEDGSAGHVVKMTGNTASYDVTPNDWYEVVKLNYGYNPETGEQRFSPTPDTWHKMDQILAYWQQEMGVDGFRVDYAHVVPAEFWQWALARAKARNPQAFFVAEAYESSPDRIPGFSLRQLLTAGFDAVYDDPLYDGLRDVALGPKWANDITAWLEQYADIEDRLLRYGENHDEVRLAAPVRPGRRDQSGLGSVWAGRPFAAVLFLSARGPNLVYAGQEVGEAGGGKEGFAQDDGRTTIFDYWTMPAMARWVGPDHAYDGRALTPEQRALREFYTRIVKLSRTEPFAGGRRYNLQAANVGQPGYGDGQWVYSFLRYDAQGRRALVVVNLNPAHGCTPTVRIPLDALAKMGLGADATVRLQSLLGPRPGASAARAGNLTTQGIAVALEPFDAAVIALDAS